MTRFIVLAALASLALVASPAFAYNSVIQTGDVVEAGAFKINIAPQIILSRYKGVGVDAMLDVGVDSSSSVRGLIGVGDGVDFQVGGLYKYIPFPDTDRQPAVGIEAGVVYARAGGVSEFDLRANPLVSKRFELEFGDLSPYAALPVGINIRSGGSQVPIQLAVGTELRMLSTANLSFFVEGAVNLYDAFGYVTGAIAWRFDEVKLKSR